MSGMLAGLLLPVAVAAVASSVPGEAELKVTGWSLFGSFMVGLVSASSLLIGAALGVYVRAPKRVVAAIMAFGAGALIESLAIELAAGGAEKLIREEHLHPLVGWLWIATGFVVGGMVYAGANLALDNAGAAARKAASLRSYVRRARREKATDMLVQLSASDLFRSLPAADLVKLIPHAETRKLGPGAVIFRTGDLSDGVYLIEEGHVEFTPGGPGGMAGNYGPGHCFGEVELVTGEARMESATALDSVKLLFIPADDFGLVMLNSPALESAVRDLVAVHTHGAASVEHHIRQQARGVDTKTWVEVGVAATKALLTRYEEISAKLAETPPMVGSVRIEMNGSCSALSRVRAAQVFAICISDSRPSCMRAPPLEEKHTSGMRNWTQCSTARTKRSPTTEPIEPPKNWNSNAQVTIGKASRSPSITINEIGRAHV